MEYQEKQKLRLWWLYILLGIEATIILSIIFLDKAGMNLQDLKDVYFLPIFSILLPFIIVYFVTENELKLTINQTGITYRYWPFTKQRTIIWDQISKLYIRKYDAFSEYGGWGLRYKLWFKFNDKAFIFNDNTLGMQLELSNDKKVLFSTDKKDELGLFLINLKKQYNIGAIEIDVRER